MEALGVSGRQRQPPCHECPFRSCSCTCTCTCRTHPARRPPFTPLAPASSPDLPLNPLIPLTPLLPPLVYALPLLLRPAQFQSDLNWTTGVDDVRNAVAYLRRTGSKKVAIVGFCQVGSG
jgi:hypothetical protein